MKTKTITGKITWQDLEMGFWGIIDHKGNEYLPINLPSNCEENGKEVKMEVEVLKDAMTMVMWGTAVRVVKVY